MEMRREIDEKTLKRSIPSDKSGDFGFIYFPGSNAFQVGWRCLALLCRKTEITNGTGNQLRRMCNLKEMSGKKARSQDSSAEYSSALQCIKMRKTGKKRKKERKGVRGLNV